MGEWLAILAHNGGTNLIFRRRGVTIIQRARRGRHHLLETLRKNFKTWVDPNIAWWKD